MQHKDLVHVWSFCIYLLLTPFIVSAKLPLSAFGSARKVPGNKEQALLIGAEEADMHDCFLRKPLTRCWEECIIYAVLCQGTSGIWAVPLQEAVLLCGTTLLESKLGKVTLISITQISLWKYYQRSIKMLIPIWCVWVRAWEHGFLRNPQVMSMLLGHRYQDKQ